MNTFGLAPLLLILPFIGFLINSLAGHKLLAADTKSGEKWSARIGTGMAMACFVIVLTLWSSLRNNGHHAEVVHLWDWINVGNFHVPWALQIDTLSVTMLFVITGVGSLIHIYAAGYMHGDEYFSRFFAYLNLFIFFMIILVASNNYLGLFVGWEGVGLCSFLLIGFWFGKDNKKKDIFGNDKYEGELNSDAARKAFVANRVGDLAMILAIGFTFWAFGSIEYQNVFDSALHAFEAGDMVRFAGTDIVLPLGWVLTAITALFLAGAAGKSAQVPLFIWLPDAMAGPTPVSALIHAATMVTSGIYLIVRSNVLFEIVREMVAHGDAPLVFGIISSNDLVALVGATTALFAGLVAFTQFDVKKVLAYSTVSQLGFMIAAVGMGAYVAGMFHLITHAFFKALLFMGSGSIIHGMEHGHHHIHDHHGHDDDGHDSHHPGEDHHDDFDPQDMRTMGGLRKQMPWTFWTYMIGALALSGIFPLAGFWSKDEILAHAKVNDGGWAFTVVLWMLTVAAFCTAFYMGRQLKMVFFGEPRHDAAEHAHESPPAMIFPLVVLSVLVIFAFMLNTPHLSDAAYEASKTAYADDAYGEEADAHGEADDHGAADDAHSAHAAGSFGDKLILEHWLEYSIESFHLTEEKIVHMPHTPVVLQMDVALQSTVLAIIALVSSFFFVYGKRPTDAHDSDPLEKLTPLWAFGKLPFDSLAMKMFVPAFNRFADFAGYRVDWDFWHDFVHENVIRGTFIRLEIGRAHV